jgi:adenine-specific DNA glycosylase
MQYDSVKTKRSLPWRVHTTESDRKGKSKQEASQRAYEVWVSEIMAQQTQVSGDDFLEAGR